MRRIDIACIIDDDPIYVFGVKKVMNVIDFSNSVMVFRDGQEALNNLKAIITANEKLPDIILLDINMPILDGWQFLDEFVKIPCKKKITIYIASSSVDPQDMLRAKKYSVVKNYVVKPISIDKLRKVLVDFNKAI
ncbi:response regulator [Aquimarina addita]|uniref:Response regulator n=1 Tax=Aquimarina addita TaxID=870485 RepID=A0ABP6UML2_9FLAO